tara:strand:+ start:485 stop:589 length:105 start_codon:yes stop_codon:yes gene_type:complete
MKTREKNKEHSAKFVFYGFIGIIGLVLIEIIKTI